MNKKLPPKPTDKIKPTPSHLSGFKERGFLFKVMKLEEFVFQILVHCNGKSVILSYCYKI